MPRTLRFAIGSLALIALAACSPPKPPEEERRPDPQAQSDARETRSAITDYADGYKDRARAVEGQLQDAADQQRARIDAQAQ